MNCLESKTVDVKIINLPNDNKKKGKNLVLHFKDLKNANLNETHLLLRISELKYFFLVIWMDFYRVLIIYAQRK